MSVNTRLAEKKPDVEQKFNFSPGIAYTRDMSQRDVYKVEKKP